MLTTAFNLSKNLSYNYNDIKANSWYEQYVGIAEKYALFPNRTEELKPSQKLTRNEVVVALYQFLQNQE